MALVTPAPRRLISAVVVPLVLLVLAACGAASTGSGSTGSGSTGGGSTSGGSSYAGLAPARATTDLPTVPVAQLPAEAVETLRLIAAGGPYPYSKDGATFSNREGRLPSRTNGWYREFTVVTPGSSDRGARRIIAGQDGARFYTSDHYASFREVVTGGTS